MTEDTAVCPKCRKRIDHARMEARGTIRYTVWTSAAREPDWELEYRRVDIETDDVQNPFLCPECDAEIAASEDELLELFGRKASP